MHRVDPAWLDESTLQWSRLARADADLTFGQLAHAWRTDEAFRQFWIECLRDVPFDAYCWECPPLQETNLEQPFECVFVASPSLARMPLDREAFGEHFRPGCRVVTFDNLGGDAVLVAPCPDTADGDFGHLASFTATASRAHQGALWEAVGYALESRIGRRPLWLNTAGHGVAWLHVRLDSRPKYYRHVPYMANRRT
jgi:hypothetical protein